MLPQAKGVGTSQCRVCGSFSCVRPQTGMWAWLSVVLATVGKFSVFSVNNRPVKLLHSCDRFSLWWKYNAPERVKLKRREFFSLIFHSSVGSAHGSLGLWQGVVQTVLHLMKMEVKEQQERVDTNVSSKGNTNKLLFTRESMYERPKKLSIQVQCRRPEFTEVPSQRGMTQCQLHHQSPTAVWVRIHFSHVPWASGTSCKQVYQQLEPTLPRNCPLLTSPDGEGLWVV